MKNPHHSPACLCDQCVPLKSRPPRFDVEVHGQRGDTVFLFRPITEAARQWIEENVQADAQWFGNGLAVEHRYVEDLINGMLADDLKVDVN